MRFRRIYWVTEQVDEHGLSEVTGVFTSIPDLVDLGLGTRDVSNKQAAFRISLCELDSSGSPILTCESPSFDGFEDALQPIVQSGEMSASEFASLTEALRAHRTA
jgi:hypothetical protein